MIQPWKRGPLKTTTLLGAALTLAMAASPAQAQAAEDPGLLSRIEQMERELAALKAQAGKGADQAEPVPELQLPGGGIDPGESPVQALHREVLEETGWRIRPQRRLGVYRRFTFMPDYDKWAEKLCMIYLARPVLCYGPPSEPGHTALWMQAGAAVRALDNEGDRHFLRALVG